MNNDAIEMFAVNAVKDSIAMSDFLSPYLNEKDKEPSWDGNVYIYKTKEHKNENLKGRLPVQVKGHVCDEQTAEEISFSMSITHLNNYLYDGGVILFVVYISHDANNRKIYYIELTPIKLRTILARAEKNSVTNPTLKLKKFPADNNKKASIFLQCLDSCRRQASFVDTKLLSMEELKTQGLLEEITVPLSGVGIKDPQRALVTSDVYMYAKIKGTDVLQPLEIILRDMQTKQIIDAEIKIADKLFYKQVAIIKESQKTTTMIGESLTFSVTDPTAPCKMDYKNSNKLRVIAKDLEFFISFVENGCFTWDDKNMEFGYEQSELGKFNLPEQKEYLEFVKNAVAVLDMLGCKKDLDIDSLSRDDWKRLNYLITAFIYKEPVSNLRSGIQPVIKMSIGNLSFVLCFQLCEGTSDTYKILDFCKTEMEFSYELNDKRYPVSQYFLLKPNDLLELDNIQFEKLLPSFQKQEINEDTFNVANEFLLDLLRAYDDSEGSRKEILDTAVEFSDWLLSDDFKDVQYGIRIINHLQSIKRTRELNIFETEKLYNIIEDSNASERIKVGAYLLLEQQGAAEMHYGKLSCEEQEEFKTYPIYHYWKKAEENENE